MYLGAPLRGQVFQVDLGSDIGRKLLLVVSNNVRNRQLDTILTVRLTTTAKRLPTIVELSPADQFVGRVVCDDLFQIYRTDLDAPRGALTAATMRRVDAGLKAALAL